MKTTIQRAKAVAHGIEDGTVWVNATLADEMASLLGNLALACETHLESLVGVEFALQYYSDPGLYYEPTAPSNMILDGGLRARTALAMLKPAHLRHRLNHHSYGETS